MIFRHKISYHIDKMDFIYAFDRRPKDKEEFIKFAKLCENGADAQLDWNIIIACAKDEFDDEEED